MTDEPTPTSERKPRPRPRAQLDLRRPQMRLGAVVALAVAVAFVVWLVVRGSDGESKGPVPKAAPAVPVSLSGLMTSGGALKRPIYWAGARPTFQYELTKTDDGRVWIRYLPKDEDIGEQETPYLAVGTYPVANAFAVTSTAAGAEGAVRLHPSNGAVAFYSKDRLTNVYLAFRGSDYQIEVFDPSASTARALVQNGQIKPIPGTKGNGSSSGAQAMTESAPKSLAARTTGPIYWIGAKPNVKYEVTQSPDGRTYIRYLPHGASVGTATQYLTIGTYPVKNALEVTKAAAKGGDAETIDVDRGGFAFYSKSSPANVHLAYPGEDYQIEVFDPSAQRAREIVSAGRLTTVR